MAFSPIDMQTNINQMHEVARHQHNRMEAMIEQQHLLDKEALEKSQNEPTKVEKQHETDKVPAKLDEQKEGERRQQQAGEQQKKKAEDEHQTMIVDDLSLGSIIDFRK